MNNYIWYMVWQGDFQKGLLYFENKYGNPTTCLVKKDCVLPIQYLIDKNVNDEEIWITGEFNDQKLRTNMSGV